MIPAFGLTGGIGSGKSTVAALFAAEGIPTLDLDAIGHQLLERDRELRHALGQAFGDSIFDPQGRILRPRLATLAFQTQTATDTLNALVHPRIRQWEEQWRAAQRNVPFLIIEASVLIESGQCERMDGVIVVFSDMRLREQRVLDRGKQDRERFHAIVQRQCSDEQRRQAATYAIDNNGTLDSLQIAVQSLYLQIYRSA